MMLFCYFYFCVFFTVSAATESYPYLHTPSLPDAIPICVPGDVGQVPAGQVAKDAQGSGDGFIHAGLRRVPVPGFFGNQEGPVITIGEGPDGQRLATIWLGSRNDRLRCPVAGRSEEHTSELRSLMRNSYALFCLSKKIH